jgi:choline dehydrogenase-like flavoprotein
VVSIQSYFFGRLGSPNFCQGPFVGGHNLVAFVPGVDFLPSPSALQSAISKQPLSKYLPKMYLEDETLLNGFFAQREHIHRAIALFNSSLIESPLAGDAYALLILQKPLSRGTITIDPRDPYDSSPLVDFGTLNNPLDMEVFMHMLRFTLRLYNTTAMRELKPEEDAIGSKVSSDKELEKYLRERTGSSIGHESGTCAMMPLELGGVVGPDLKVHGVQGLRVVDASIIPLIPSTNLCATVYAVAEKVG